MSQWSATNKDSRSPTPTSSPPHGYSPAPPFYKPDPSAPVEPYQQPHAPYPVQTRFPLEGYNPSTPQPSSPHRTEHVKSPRDSLNESPTGSPAGRQRSSSRPLSMIQTWQPHMMDVNEDTIPELQPVFTLLNSHANKLYQEGYFLKLDDQNAQGKPNPDRTWTECFAQLVGTVLSLWDAAELDAAGEEGEVLPKFINLTDASIKMIESLPTRTNDEQPLQNILSISTAGRNRYLLHFNSHHSLVQWTAGIRLAMFEHSTLQEAYTGALIAGKGKTLNNIGVIMDRTKVKIEEWVRVRFGAGVPWRRCWCVISPPDEKEFQKLQKDLKKRSPYDRSHVPLLKGDIKFYDSKKDAEKKKRSRPVASITDAYSAYAIYPQAKSLIDKSTLLKVEGNITIHSDPPSSTEGFVFIMPETSPMVSGFEMLLRFLFPTWDTFGLYGRPGRLVASALDSRSLMFAMPKHKRYGYLEILDVSGLISEDGSAGWSERDWRKNLKELTGKRMNTMEEGSKTHGRSASRSSKRLSFGPMNTSSARPKVNFADDTASVRTSRSRDVGPPGARTDSAPPDHNRERAPSAMAGNPRHSRNISDTQLDQEYAPHGFDAPHGMMASPVNMRGPGPARAFATDLASTPERVSSEDEGPPRGPPFRQEIEPQRMQTPEPVNAPPAFSHGVGSKPTSKPYHSPELRRANSRLSSTTLAQLAKAGGMIPESFPDEIPARQSGDGDRGAAMSQYDPRGPAVQPHANLVGMSANSAGSHEALTSPNRPDPYGHSPGLPPPQSLGQKRSKSPLAGQYRPSSAEGAYQQSYHPGGMGASSVRPSPGAAPRPPGLDTLTGYRAPAPPAPYSAGPYPPQWQPPQGPPPQGPPPQGPPPQGPPPQYSAMGPPPASGRRTPPGQGTRPPSQTSPPINRKPLPVRTASLQRQESNPGPPSPASSGSFTNRMLDDAALAQVYARDPEPRPGLEHRQQSDLSHSSSVSRYDQQSSHYEDDEASTASPDYASTRKSTETQESVERPRAGVLRTVGMSSGAPQYAEPSAGYVVPAVDFGPTVNYAAQPASRIKEPSAVPQAGASGPSGGPSSGGLQNPSPHANSPGPNPPFTHYRSDSDETVRRVAWQPGGAAIGSGGAERAMSPAEFVQHRAAAAATPMYAHGHQRQASGNTLAGMRAGSATPPLKRSSSQDKLSQMGALNSHSRNNSGELLAGGRPPTPGSTNALSAGEMSSRLSAQEQTLVARATGTPLIQMAGNARAQDAGLLGHIDARERERAQAKAGLQTQAVTQAIDQRQREQQFHAQRAAQIAYQQQQAQFAQQQGQIYGGGMGMNASSMSMPLAGPNAPSMYNGGMAPRSMSPGPGMMSQPMAPGMGPPRSMSPGPGRMGQPMAPGMQQPRSMSPGPGMMVPQQRSMSPGPGMMGQGMMPGQPRMQPGPGQPRPVPQQGNFSRPGMAGRPPQLQQPFGGMGPGMGGQPQSPGWQQSPQHGQFSPQGSQPGTPNQMQPPYGRGF